MRSVFSCLGAIGVTALCACMSYPRKKAVDGVAVPQLESWAGCSVANAVAKQFIRAGMLLNELDPFVDQGRIVFRICDAETLDCNRTPQPFAEVCVIDLSHQTSRKVSKAAWSPRGLPVERETSYLVIFLHESPGESVFEWDLHYRFRGSPFSGGTSPGVLAGVSEVRGDAPTVRVAIGKSRAFQTQSSAILFGEQSLE
jgi:hypothetical protein